MSTKEEEEEEVTRGVKHARDESNAADSTDEPDQKRRRRRGWDSKPAEEEKKEEEENKEESSGKNVLPNGSAIDEAIRKAREIAASMKLPKIVPKTGPASTNGSTDTRVRKKVIVPVESNPGFNWMGLLIGPRGATQKRLEADSGCKVLIRGEGAQRKDDVRFDQESAKEPLHVLIVGMDEASAQKGEDLVKEILFDPDIRNNLKNQQLGGRPDPRSDPSPIEMNVPDHVVGFIIGHRGESIRQIQALSGAHVRIIRREEMPPGPQGRMIYIRGTEESKMRAKEMIQAAMQHRGALQTAMTSQGGGVTVYLKLPDDKVGLVIGKGGQTIRYIQDSTRSNIQIPKYPDADNPTVRTATVSGPDQATVDRAQAEIWSYINQTNVNRGMMAGGGMGGVGAPLNVEIPDHKAGLIIGRQGATINQLQQKYRCHIQVPNQQKPGSNPPKREVVISGGHPDAHNAAKAEILTIIDTDPRDGGPGHTVQGTWVPGGQQQQQQQYGGYGGGYYQQQQYGYGGYYQQNPYAPQQSTSAPDSGTKKSDGSDDQYNAVPPPTSDSNSSSSKVSEQPQVDEATRIAAWKAYYAQQAAQQQQYYQYYQQQQQQQYPGSQQNAPSQQSTASSSQQHPPPPGPPGPR